MERWNKGRNDEVQMMEGREIGRMDRNEGRKVWLRDERGTDGRKEQK